MYRYTYTQISSSSSILVVDETDGERRDFLQYYFNTVDFLDFPRISMNCL